MALNQTDLLALIQANLPDNVTKDISPEDLRDVLDEIVDSYYNNITNIIDVNLSEYDPTKSYLDTVGVIYSGAIYQAISATTAGPFDSNEWNMLAPFSAATDDFILKTNGVELDNNKKLVVNGVDNNITNLVTGFYEIEGSTVTTGLDKEYPALGKASLQVQRGSSNSNSLHIFTPFNFTGVMYIRNLSNDWVEIDLSSSSTNLNFQNGTRKIGNDVELGGAFDTVNLNASSSASAFNINGSAIKLQPDSASGVTVVGKLEVFKGNQGFFLNNSDIHLTSTNQVRVTNLKPVNKATYLSNNFPDGIDSAGDRDVPDVGLLRDYVSDTVATASLGADFENGLSSTTIITSATTATTVGLGGALVNTTDIALSGQTFRLIGDETLLRIDEDDIELSHANITANTNYRLAVDENSAGLVYSDSAQTSDLASIKIQSDGAHINADVTQAGNSVAMTDNLMSLNVPDLRLTLIPNTVAPTVNDQVVLRDNSNGMLRRVDIANLGITGQTGTTLVSSPFDYNVSSTGGIEPISGSNLATGAFATIVNGQSNRATGTNALVGGISSSGTANAAIAFGINSIASSSFAVAIGLENEANGTASEASGYLTQANGGVSHAEGYVTQANADFSHAEGYNTVADGIASHAEGLGTTATGTQSHAEGAGTTALGFASHSEGRNTDANNTGSHAEGVSTAANGYASHAEGQGTISSGDWSHAEGFETLASGEYSHTEGYKTTATTDNAHAEGYLTTANATNSHAEGRSTTATGAQSHAEGNLSVASGSTSHAEGYNTTANAFASHSEGASTTASGNYSHAQGFNTQSNGNFSHSEGQFTQANNNAAHAEGSSTIASGNFSHSEGNQTMATGTSSHAEGAYTQAFGDNSHAEGKQTIASGFNSHAEGIGTQAGGYSSHAEGENTIAGGARSHAEGYNTLSSGDYSHAEGRNSIASGDYSHAEGQNTVSSGNWSHAEGNSSISSGFYSHAEGKSSQATGTSSHAEGAYSQANGLASHSEGLYTQANGFASHAEGQNTRAENYSAHAEGNATQALGESSHAQNNGTIARGAGSHAGGSNSEVIGENGFIHSNNSLIEVDADNSSILGGVNSLMASGVTGSTILGGNAITGTSNDTVYGVNFDASGTIYSGGTDLSLLFGGGSGVISQNGITGDGTVGTPLELGDPITKSTTLVRNYVNGIMGYDSDFGIQWGNGLLQIYSLSNDTGDAFGFSMPDTEDDDMFLGFIQSGGTELGFDFGTTGFIAKDAVSNKGIVYAADYSVSGTTDPLWIPNWGTVESAITASTVSTDNGINGTGLASDPIELGGDLTKTSTLLATSGKDLILSAKSGGEIEISTQSGGYFTANFGSSSQNEINVAGGPGLQINGSTWVKDLGSSSINLLFTDGIKTLEENITSTTYDIDIDDGAGITSQSRVRGTLVNSFVDDSITNKRSDIQQTTSTTYLATTSGTNVSEISIVQDKITLSTSSGLGVLMNADYSANYTDRSIVDKAYVDGTSFPIVTPITASTYTIVETDNNKILHVTRSLSGTCTITWPTALMNDGFKVTIKDAGRNATTNNITIDTQGAETIDGNATWLIDGDGDWVKIYCDGTNLNIIG